MNGVISATANCCNTNTSLIIIKFYFYLCLFSVTAVRLKEKLSAHKTLFSRKLLAPSADQLILLLFVFHLDPCPLLPLTSVLSLFPQGEQGDDGSPGAKGYPGRQVQ